MREARNEPKPNGTPRHSGAASVFQHLQFGSGFWHSATIFETNASFVTADADLSAVETVAIFVNELLATWVIVALPPLSFWSQALRAATLLSMAGFPLELSLAGWQTDMGRFFTGIIRDITERKRAEQEREKLIGELK
jgi:hypothetical protein